MLFSLGCGRLLGSSEFLMDLMLPTGTMSEMTAARGLRKRYTDYSKYKQLAEQYGEQFANSDCGNLN